MKIRDLVKLLESFENYEDAEVRVCVHNGVVADIDSIEWDPSEHCYTIYCVGENEPV